MDVADVVKHIFRQESRIERSSLMLTVVVYVSGHLRTSLGCIFIYYGVPPPLKNVCILGFSCASSVFYQNCVCLDKLLVTHYTARTRQRSVSRLDRLLATTERFLVSVWAGVSREAARQENLFTPKTTAIEENGL